MGWFRIDTGRWEASLLGMISWRNGSIAILALTAFVLAGALRQRSIDRFQVGAYLLAVATILIVVALTSALSGRSGSRQSE